MQTKSPTREGDGNTGTGMEPAGIAGSITYGGFDVMTTSKEKSK